MSSFDQSCKKYHYKLNAFEGKCGSLLGALIRKILWLYNFKNRSRAEQDSENRVRLRKQFVRVILFCFKQDREPKCPTKFTDNSSF